MLTYRRVTSELDSGRPHRAEPAPAQPDVAGIALLCFGIYLVGLSVLMLALPGTFFAEVAPFGEQNDHYLRDAATFQITLGCAALIAFRRPQWRVPVLALL